MQMAFRTTFLIVFAMLLGTQSQAKSFNTCDAAFKFYEKDNRRHKAFATTNGSLPGRSNDVVCGGDGGDDLGRAVYTALTQCQLRAKKEHFSGKCLIYRKR